MTEESRRRRFRGTAEVSGRTFVAFLVVALVVGVAVAIATHALATSATVSTACACAEESVAATWWREWWDAVSAGALAAVSVILAVTIWAKPLPDASPAAQRRTLGALTAVTVVVASFPVVTLLTRVSPLTMAGLWMLAIGAGGLSVVFLCIALPIGLGQRVPPAPPRGTASISPPPGPGPGPGPGSPPPQGTPPPSPEPPPHRIPVVSAVEPALDARDDGVVSSGPHPEGEPPPVRRPRGAPSRVIVSTLAAAGAALIAIVAFMLGRRSRR
ncbi:hypothetical protein JVX92_06630 [Microbacterium hominis]|uniref:hypothetical protein n=1 Tax=Microbacterium hominis TaxID=162426 RepID=UPI001964C91C|nr:hypothetical protein [Microbacterium hominis]QRY41907.1 hypothetical protein JVX92_06630 [Microbacterium hominis]